VIYPLTRDEAASAEEGEDQKQLQLLDGRLDQLMGVVRLRYLLQRQGGWDSVAEWQDVLSLGLPPCPPSPSHPLPAKAFSYFDPHLNEGGCLFQGLVSTRRRILLDLGLIPKFPS
jgi:hypothetical protein